MTRISGKHYKSLESFDIEISSPLLVFVGRNNSGKSNCLTLLKFLSDSGERNLDEALAERGGFKEIIWQKDTRHSIEVALTFSLDNEFRNRIIDDWGLARDPVARDKVLASKFLRDVTYSAHIGKDNDRDEELSTLNISGDKLSLLNWKHESSEMCAQNARLLYSSGGKTLGANYNVIFRVPRLNRMCLGDFSRWPGTTSSLARLALVVRENLITLKWFSPIRSGQAQSEIKGETVLDPEGHNLADVLHALFSNDDPNFKDAVNSVSRIIPNVGNFFTPTTTNKTTPAYREVFEGKEVSFTLEQMSYGTRMALQIFTSIFSSSKYAVHCFEEPEVHFHPSAQEDLLNLFAVASQSRRIMMTTHSPILASSVPYNSLYLATRESGKGTVVKRVNDENVAQVVSELGVRPSYNFEADVVVLVEGKEDLPIYQEWAAQYEVTRRVQFIPVGGCENMAYFANVQILKRRRLDTEIFVVFDGDTEQDEEKRLKKEKLLKFLPLPPSQIWTLDEREVEGYLFNLDAIRNAFPKSTMPADSDKKLAELKTKEGKQRKMLEQFLKECGIGPYTGEVGAMIAHQLKRPDKIESLFAAIKGKLRIKEL